MSEPTSAGADEIGVFAETARGAISRAIERQGCELKVLRLGDLRPPFGRPFAVRERTEQVSD